MLLTGPAIQNEINRTLEVSEIEFPRTYLGMSSMGHPCMRKSWFNWRWYTPEAFSSRMKRLFKRGHNEEERFIDHLRLIGIKVEEIDPATGEQFEFISSDGHCMGHCDGKASYRGFRYCAEFKTHNKASYNQVRKIQDVKLSFPTHYYQGQRYMHEMGVDYCIYGAVCKDNDSLHWEVFKKDMASVRWLQDREKSLIFATTVPPKLSQRPTYYQCTWCWFKGICHGGQEPWRTCRSCISGALVDNGGWVCLKRKKERKLSLNEQLRGCKKHSFISGL